MQGSDVITSPEAPSPKGLSVGLSSRINHFVVIVLAVVAWANATFLAEVLAPLWATGHEIRAGVYLAIQLVLLSFGLRSYYLAVVTHPGRVPVAWSVQKAYSKVNGEYVHRPRWCPACVMWKPPRTHHCTLCKQCILRYDHHCPWLANCVGYYNHKFFMLVVFFFLAMSWFVVAVSTEQGLACTSKGIGVVRGDTVCLVPDGAPRINFCVMFWFVLVLGVMLAIFGTQHLLLLARNKTTVETLEVEPPEGNIYDLGSCSRNFETLCGPRRDLWPAPEPVHPPNDTGGLLFEISADAIAHQRQHGIYRPPTYGTIPYTVVRPEQCGGMLCCVAGQRRAVAEPRLEEGLLPPSPMSV